MSPAVLAPIGPVFAEAAAFTEATLDALLPRPSGPRPACSRRCATRRWVAASGCARFSCCKAGGCSALTGVRWGVWPRLLAYQIADDLLDFEGEASETGKEVHKDTARGKAMLLSVLGPERARAQAEALVAQAASHLDLFDEKADLLRAAARFMIARKS